MAVRRLVQKSRGILQSIGCDGKFDPCFFHSGRVGWRQFPVFQLLIADVAGIQRILYIIRLGKSKRDNKAAAGGLHGIDAAVFFTIGFKNILLAKLLGYFIGAQNIQRIGCFKYLRQVLLLLNSASEILYSSFWFLYHSRIIISLAQQGDTAHQ